jgi:hypothetical protein
LVLVVLEWLQLVQEKAQQQVVTILFFLQLHLLAAAQVQVEILNKMVFLAVLAVVVETV